MAERSDKKPYSWKRWLAISAVIVVFAAFLLYRFYNTIQTPSRAILEQDRLRAVKELHLKEISSIERFISDRPYTVIQGVYNETPVVAWLWDGGYHLEKLSDGITSDEIKAMVLQDHPAKQLLRITPGVLRNYYVWEVFYSLPDADGKDRKYYDYYQFSDGRKIETYRLAKPL